MRRSAADSLEAFSPRSGGQDRQLAETVMGATVSAILFAAKKSEAAPPQIPILRHIISM
jgi:hypothetical protein